MCKSKDFLLWIRCSHACNWQIDKTTTGRVIICMQNYSSTSWRNRRLSDCQWNIIPIRFILIFTFFFFSILLLLMWFYIYFHVHRIKYLFLSRCILRQSNELLHFDSDHQWPLIRTVLTFLFHKSGSSTMENTGDTYWLMMMVHFRGYYPLLPYCSWKSDLRPVHLWMMCK